MKQFLALLVFLTVGGLLVNAGQNLAPEGSSVTVGTGNTLAKFNAGATDLADSVIVDDGSTVDITTDTINMITALGYLTFSADGALYITEDTDWDAYIYLEGDDGVNGEQIELVSNGRQRFLSGYGQPTTASIELKGELASGLGYVSATSGIIELSATVLPMDGTDIMKFVFIDGVNADHTGSNNKLYGLDIDAITPDGQAIEQAIHISDGWDYEIGYADGTGFIVSDDGNGATTTFTIHDGAANDPFIFTRATIGIGVNTELVQFIGTTDVMAGGNIIEGVVIALTNADHTGGTLHGLGIDGITGDADATEAAINIGDGWDYAITIPDGGVADNSISLGDAQDVDIFWSGSGVAFDMDGINQATDFSVLLRSNVSSNFIVQTVAIGNSMNYYPVNATNAGFDIFEIDVGAVFATDGSDIINMLLLDWNETDWATATETLNGLMIDGITQDAQGLYYGVHVGTAWDAALYSEGVAHAALAATANGSMVFCTNCDPASTPCTTGGASTGAWAFRVNGQWDCPW
jgi:hypothetical protein